MIIPILFVAYYYFIWVGNKLEILYASVRMLLQLLLVGYLLSYVFVKETSYTTIFIVVIMISTASIITLRNITKKSLKIYILNLPC